MLETIIKTRVPLLTVKDQEKLRDHMNKITTPPLPGTEEERVFTAPETAEDAEVAPWPTDPEV